MIFSKKTLAFGQKQCGRSQCCLQGNHLTYPNIAKFQSLIQNPWDESSVFSALHLKMSRHVPCNQSGKTPNKKTWKKKEKYRRQKQTQKNPTITVGIYASNVASTACKDLSHVTYFNSGKKGHYGTKCPKLKKNKGYSQTSSANEFRASSTLPPSKKNLYWLYLTQKVRSMLYTLPLLKNWASKSDQSLLEISFDVRA